MLNESTVDAGQENVVDSQQTEVVETAEPTETVETESSDVVETESASSEVATEPVKQVQSQDDNAKFADVRRKAEQAGRDKFISDQYGKSHNIHTEADYKAAIAKQKQTDLEESVRSGEVDPKEAYEQMKANDPDFQALKKSQEETSINNQIKQLNTDLKDLDIELEINSLDDIVKLDNVDEITKHIDSGKTLAEAYFLANKKQIIEKRAERVQTETLNKVASLESANPGSLNNPGESKPDSIYDLSEADFKKMQEDVIMGRHKK